MANSMTAYWTSVIIMLPIFIGVFSIAAYFLTKVAKFDFTFTIGDKEKHEIRFYSERMFAQNKIYVDGVQVLSKFNFINGDSRFSVAVGNEEKHNLLFYIKMDVFFGSYKRRTCFVYDNDVLISTVVSGK